MSLSMPRIVQASLSSFVLLLSAVMPMSAQAARVPFGAAVWNISCPSSHLNMDDPIVAPGQTGSTHLHQFFGNETTNAATTTDSLAAGASDCRKGMNDVDHSAYWVPALMQMGGNGQAMPVVGSKGATTSMTAYYTMGGNDATAKPFPLGLRMIAGDSHATGLQPTNIVEFMCAEGSMRTKPTATLPSCTGKQVLVGIVFFPNCWNGKDLDSADHKSHMSYAINKACPATHPVKLPRLSTHVRWNIQTNASNLAFSSGGQNTFHADFWNVWNPPALQELVTTCLNGHKNCVGLDRTQIKAATVPVPHQNPSGNPIPSISPTPSSSPMPSDSPMPSMSPVSSGSPQASNVPTPSGLPKPSCSSLPHHIMTSSQTKTMKMQMMCPVVAPGTPTELPPPADSPAPSVSPAVLSDEDQSNAEEVENTASDDTTEAEASPKALTASANTTAMLPKAGPELGLGALGALGAIGYAYQARRRSYRSLLQKLRQKR